MNAGKTYNVAIDYWKFFFALMVVEYHRALTYGGVLGGGYIAVDFFFIVTGYLMVQSFMDRMKEINNNSIGRETVSFLWKKMRKLYPYILINVLFSFGYYNVYQGREGFITTINRLRYLVFELLPLNMSGFSEQVRYVNWYISGMFLALMLLYPVLLLFKENYVYIISPLIVILIYGWISQNIGYVRGTEFAYYGILRLGVWRGIAGISAGSLCWSIVEYLSKVHFSKYGRVFISFAMICSIAVIVSNTIIYPASQQDFVSILFIVLLVALIFSKKGILYGLYRPKLGKYLREWSVALFVLAGSGWTLMTEIEHTIMGEVSIISTKWSIIVYYINTVLGVTILLSVLKIINLAVKNIKK